MHVSRISLENIRCFDGCLSLALSSRINLLVGPNNSGKSTIIWAIGILQPDSNAWQGSEVFVRSLRDRTKVGEITSFYESVDDRLFQPSHGTVPNDAGLLAALCLRCQPSGGVATFLARQTSPETFDAGGSGPATFSNNEPNNLFRFFLSRRKSVGYDHSINLQTTRAVARTFQFVHAKVARLAVSTHPRHEAFQNYMMRVLGFRLGSAPSVNGQETALFLPSGEHIALDFMGEGIANIVALLADLAVSENKVFLIEELENDIHPAALATLLEIIDEKSATNQFILSTHSNVLVSRLGSLETTKIFSFSSTIESGLPTTTVTPLTNTAEARQELLRALGYEPSDLGLADGYLVFEESSAESIVNQVLIPLFVPSLAGRLKTYAANGASKTPSKYEALHRVFVFLSGTPVYREKSWVRVDGDDEGQKAVLLLREKFKSNQADVFHTYSQPAFEHYYPDDFRDEVARVLALDKGARRTAKQELCRKVLAWAREDLRRATQSFEKSAAEVIEDLRKISTQLS